MMYELALFAGAGGGLLATKWLLGWQTVGYVEHNTYRVKVLKSRIRDGLLDDAPIWSDIRSFTKRNNRCRRFVRELRKGRGSLVVTAGFPCQPFSKAGRRKGEDDERNMWPHTIRCIREIRPRYVLLENVRNLLSVGYFGTILGDLADSGYDARWRVLSASELGAPHKRDRLWIVAHDNGRWQLQQEGSQPYQWGWSGDGGEMVAHAHEAGLERWRRAELQERPGEWAAGTSGTSVSDAEEKYGARSQSEGNAAWDSQATFRDGDSSNGWWLTDPADSHGAIESQLGRVVDGMANRMVRLEAIGDGQVPAVVEAVWWLLTGEEK